MRSSSRARRSNSGAAQGRSAGVRGCFAAFCKTISAAETNLLPQSRPPRRAGQRDGAAWGPQRDRERETAMRPDRPLKEPWPRRQLRCREARVGGSSLYPRGTSAGPPNSSPFRGIPEACGAISIGPAHPGTRPRDCETPGNGVSSPVLPQPFPEGVRSYHLSSGKGRFPSVWFPEPSLFKGLRRTLAGIPLAPSPRPAPLKKTASERRMIEVTRLLIFGKQLSALLAFSIDFGLVLARLIRGGVGGEPGI